MDRATSGEIIDILRSTLLQLQEIHDNPVVLGLKKNILLIIAQLEITKALMQLEEMAADAERHLEIHNESERRAA